MSNWHNFAIRYWDQNPRVNDTHGNSVSKIVRARNEAEAKRKFEAWHSKYRREESRPRYHSIEKREIPATPKERSAVRQLAALRSAVRQMLVVRDREANEQCSTEDLLDAIAELEREL